MEKMSKKEANPPTDDAIQRQKEIGPMVLEILTPTLFEDVAIIAFCGSAMRQFPLLIEEKFSFYHLDKG